MVTCGTCTCPTPLPTLPAGEFCTAINGTHVVCGYGLTANGMSWMNAFVSGIFVTLVLIGVILAVRYLTTPANKEDNK
jgi:hypothetical protein